MTSSEMNSVRMGSKIACQPALQQRPSLREMLPFRRGNGRSRAGGPETAFKLTFRDLRPNGHL